MTTVMHLLLVRSSICNLGLLLVLLSLSASLSIGQLTDCYYQGYNLTELTGADLYYSDATAMYAIRPCGVVADQSFCTDTVGGGEFCQGSTTISIMNVSNAVDPPNRGALWAQLEIDGEFGVTQFLQDGTYCGDINADREGTIVYVCNATATVPFISNVTELSRCHYRAVIQTAVLCSHAPATGIPIPIGTNILSSQCGGGIYDLSPLNAADIISGSLQDIVSNDYYTYVVRICGLTTSSPCIGASSVCQVDNYYAGVRFTLAVWEPTISPVVWQYLGDSSVAAIYQDGQGCGTGVPNNRLTNVTFTCNATATTPVIVSGVEGPTCSYLLTVQTDLVCGAAFRVPLPTSSSSSSAAPLPSMSSSSAGLISGLSSSASFASSTGSSRPPSGALTECYFQGYNLTALTGADLYFPGNGLTWAIHPCGVVTDPSLCSDTPGGGEFCQGAITVSIMNVSNAVDPPNRGALWAQLEIDGEFGVTQFLQDGTYCGDILADREGTIVYVCNATATTPFISSVAELTECHYQAIIQTSLLCPQVPSAGISTAVGTNILSSQCGGGIYDLSSLSAADITSSSLYDSVANDNYTYVVRLCGLTDTSPCSGSSSICQIDDLGQGAFTLALWEPASSPVIWQYLSDGLVSAIFQDGQGCDTGEPNNRLTNITLSCNTSASEPAIVAAQEGPQCTYLLTVQTDLVCGPAFQSTSPESSSTAAARVIGDPQFMGLRGQSFQVHGIDGAVYNLIVDHGMMLNARFRYLSAGRCAAFPGASNCWSHPGSYLGEIGVVSAGGAKLHVMSGSWQHGFDSVTLDGVVLSVGANTSAAGMDVALLTAYTLRVRVGNFDLLLENSDRFVNLVETRVLHRGRRWPATDCWDRRGAHRVGRAGRSATSRARWTTMWSRTTTYWAAR